MFDLLKIGDLVKPDKDAKSQAGWNPQGELRIVSIHKGIITGQFILKAEDERGYSYTGMNGCFEKIRN